MTTYAMTKTLSGLSPADDQARLKLGRLKQGEVVQVTFQGKRRHKALARWWLLCHMIVENTDQYGSAEQASDHLKILAGHCSTVCSKATGEIYLIPSSISFAALSEDEFQEVWLLAVKAVCTHILPGVEEQAVQDEILRLMEGRR